MAAYVYPGNLNFRTVQSIPVDINHKLRQGSNGVDAATKIQDLHVEVIADGNVDKNAVVTCTVAQVVVPHVVGGNTVKVPAYRVNVNGWTSTTDSVNTLAFRGGFPRSFTSDQNVNPTAVSAVLPEGTITTYEAMPEVEQNVLCQFPAVVLIGGLPVTLVDKADGIVGNIPYWSLVTRNYCMTSSQHNFNFAFNLIVQPGTD